MSRRISQINELIKRELSQIISREVDIAPNVLITITRVETSVDLNQAKVYIGIIPENCNLEVIQVLNKLIYSLQKKLNQRLKMKFVPKIKFIKEEKTKEADRIEALLQQIEEEKKEKEKGKRERKRQIS